MTSKEPSTNESNQDVNGRPVTPNETNYRDGYVQGQVSEQRYQSERDRASESNGAATGLLIGTLLAALVGGAIALFYYNSQDRQPNVIVQPTTAPAASPQAQQTPQPQQTTIIERTRTIERAQPVVPPQVNIEVPSPAAPAAPAAPAPQPSQAAPQAAPQTAPAPAAESNTQPAPVEPAAPAQQSGGQAPPPQ